MGYLDRLMETSGLAFAAPATQPETANAVATEMANAPPEIHDTVIERRMPSSDFSVQMMTAPPSSELSVQEVTPSRPSAPRPALPTSEPVDGEDASRDVRLPISVEVDSAAAPPFVVVSAAREDRIAPRSENERPRATNSEREVNGTWTLATVNDWISAPVRDVVDTPREIAQAEVVISPVRESVRRAEEESFAMLAPVEIAEFGSFREKGVTAEPETNVTVSIGAIEVIVDAPAPPPKREPSEPALQPNSTTGARLSRYYIRPPTGL